MKRLPSLICACALAATIFRLAPLATAAPALTYSDLVKRLTDVSQLAVLPVPGEQGAQWSSYDRASRYDEATGQYRDWGANKDGDGIIRQEGGQVVMAEMEGPGCIWRIWSARAQAGHVKIYLDGSQEPVVDMPFHDYFDGKHAPFNYPGLSYNLAEVESRGQNLYFPIPYQKSCKVVADKGWGAYFQFNYATYPKGTVIPTFSNDLAAKHAKELTAVNEFLTKNLGHDPAGPRNGERVETKTVQAAPGQTATVLSLKGPQAISYLHVKTSFRDRKDEMAGLRNMALRITWDGEQQPAVWCPLGDFFGTAPGVNFYQTITTGMNDQGYFSFWYMPFGKSALIELVNEDNVARTLEFQVTYAPLERPFEGLGHFHVKWHRDTKALPDDRSPDWTMIQTQGRGRFCGVMLHVWNPRGGWWGEGDEKFFVDGEKFPSTIGTGSEDYFGYAWCNGHYFQKPFHAQSMTENNMGHQSVLRWHISDNVPFQTSFEGSIEKYKENVRTLYACSTVWYLAPGGTDPYKPVPVSERDGYYRTPEVTVAGIKVLRMPPGQIKRENMAQYGEGKWKNNEQLLLAHTEVGATMELAVPVAKSGKYQVSVNLTKAPGSVIAQLLFDGQKAGEPINLYSAEVVPTGPIVLGTYDLTEGQHVLSVRFVGPDRKPPGRNAFGIDRIELKPAY